MDIQLDSLHFLTTDLIFHSFAIDSHKWRIYKTKLREVFARVCMRGVERGRVLICWKSGNTTLMKYYHSPIYSLFPFGFWGAVDEYGQT